MASLPTVSPAPRTAPASAYGAWAAVCVIWGTTYLAIRIALETIPPGLLGGFRFTLAGLALCVVVRLRGERLPPRSGWPMQAVIGMAMLGIGNGFVVVAEQWIPSGIAAVGVASAPFWMTGFESLAGGERVTRRMLAGFVLGFAGIVVLIWPDLVAGGPGGGRFIAGIVAVQLACFGWSAGSSLSKRHTPHGSALGGSALQQLFGGIAMLMVSAAFGEWHALTLSTRSISAELYLIVFGSLGAYSAYVYALQHLPISTVSLYAYINPVIAVVLGTLIANEPFSPRIGLAAAMVFGGIALVRSGYRPDPATGSRPDPATGSRLLAAGSQKSDAGSRQS